ncbi:MAG: 4-hydroxy-tetrahydrodipicolinate synthase [Phycisphaeraceae bacterium]
MIQGTMTAMITPFARGRVDFDRLRRNVAFQIEHGVDGLVPVGTTGESPTLSHDEHKKVIEVVVEAAHSGGGGGGGKVKVIAGTGSNSTDEALELTRHAKQVGADAALMVNPYYNKPTQEGLYRHFMTIADEVGLPIVLYNIPGRVAVTMSPQTVARLAKHPSIVGIKEATGSLDIATEILSLCDITVISGDDSLTLPLISIGAKGAISALSNLIPDRVKAMVAAALSGHFAEARAMHLKLFPLFKGMFIETNPIPIKTALHLAGMDSGELRLPLCEMAAENRAQLEQLLREHGVLDKAAAVP